MNTLILTVCYNTPDFVEHQYKSLQKYFKDNFQYVVYDNTAHSDNTFFSEKLKDICEKNNITRKYIPQEIYSVQYLGKPYYPKWDTSTSAGKSITYAIQCALKENYDRIFLVDTDMFFINDFYVNNYKNDITGIIQKRQVRETEINYLSNQLFLINPKCIKKDIDFLPCKLNGVNLDCGGNLRVLFEEKKDIGYFTKDNQLEPKIKDLFDRDMEISKLEGQKNYFMELYDNKILHFRAGTNWINIDNYKERVNNLIKFLNYENN